eukprot:m.101966 g.101966  ORF g.101966 m.101966 type:complete len:133 (-) comp51516_c0_seq3:159-557(-)
MRLETGRDAPRVARGDWRSRCRGLSRSQCRAAASTAGSPSAGVRSQRFGFLVDLSYLQAFSLVCSPGSSVYVLFLLVSVWSCVVDPLQVGVSTKRKDKCISQLEWSCLLSDTNTTNVKENNASDILTPFPVS